MAAGVASPSRNGTNYFERMYYRSLYGLTTFIQLNGLKNDIQIHYHDLNLRKALIVMLHVLHAQIS